MDILFYIAAALGLLLAGVLCWFFCILIVLTIMRFNSWADRCSRSIARNARRIS